jgi:hypothetical protein
MKPFAIALLSALTLGCGSAIGGTAGGAGTSGLAGRVWRGPTTPLCRVNQRCEEPAAGVKLVFYRSSKVFGQATTNQRGWYRITLSPGAYTVRTNKPAFQKVPQPHRVSVASTRYKRVDFHIDTGIR